MELQCNESESQFFQPFSCAVCGEEHPRPLHWFLLTENRWMNRVKILLWSDMLACQAGVLAVCCAEHAQELVAHWMGTGFFELSVCQASRRERVARYRCAAR